MTYTLELNEQEKLALLQLLDLAVKAGGLGVAEAALVLARKVKDAEETTE
jgi:hypothetical protein